MTKDTAHAPAAARDTSPTDLLKGEIDHARIGQFKQQVFRSVASVEKLRDWAQGPTASGLQRGLALWAIGRHADAVPLLAPQKSNAAVANCLAQSYIALRKLDAAEELLGARQHDAEQAITWLRVLEARGDAAALAKGLAKVQGILPAADQKFFAGRVKELEHDTEAAIALYDEALAQDENHTDTLFRLALNVDLRGEDEEARELYERALMVPPVNVACVMNLGILYEDMGNYRRAMQCFDLALQADPDNERARMYRRDANAALNMYYDEDQERREDRRNKILRTPINDFELSVRSRNCLTNMNIRTLGDLVKKTEAELLSYKNFGETSLMEIKEILRIKGLRLGMGADDLMHRDLGEPEPQPASPDEMPDPNSPDPARRPVTELDLSVRSRRVVDLLRIRTIGDLANKTEAELLACPNFGQTSLNEIKTKLDELGLALRG
jgi:DNA-directed RNA polymerase subunit alpha